MNSTQQRISTLSQRRQEVQRELEDIAATKSQSENSALADLETALVSELDKIDRQIQQLHAYLNQIENKPTE